MTSNLDRSHDSSVRPPPDPAPSRSSASDAALEELIARFEAAWQRAAEPRLDDFLPASVRLRAKALVELVHTDLECRLKAHCEASVEAYLTEYPELAQDRSAVIELIVADCTYRQRLGHACSPADYASRFPDLREELLARLPRVAAAHGELPRRLGRFELVEEAGQGSFGTVYRAYDTDLRRVVAVKVPRLGALTPHDEIDRFLREGRNAARLAHPGIVPVYEAGQTGGICYLVSEFVQGRTLAARLMAETPSFDEAAQLAAQLADALDAAHTAGVVHRDVKPANILLGADGRPRLMDFGLAKATAADATMTTAGQLLGTPAYMSPEQARGQIERIDARTDIYGLGAVLFHLLVGAAPFVGTQHDVLMRVARDERRRPRQLRPDIPRDLETICQRAMAFEPERRYANARDLADDLRRYLRREPIEARPAGIGERLWKWSRRRPAVAALLAVSAFALLVLLAGNAWRQWQLAQALAVADEARLRAETERGVAEMRERRVRQFLRAADFRLAYQAWQNVDVAQADAILARYKPAGGDPAEADFAWRLLHRICHDELQTLVGHEGDVYCVAFSPQGQTLATAGKDGTVRIWSRENNKTIRELPGHAGEVNALVYSPDGCLLASASDDQSIRLWNTETGETITQLRGHSDFVLAVAISPDGKTLASGARDMSIVLWDIASGESIATLWGHCGPIQSLAYSSDGALLASASSDGTAVIWDAASREILQSMCPSAGAILSVSFAPASHTLATACEVRHVHLWNADNGARRATLEGHTAQVQSAVFIGAESHLVSCDKHGTLREFLKAPEGSYTSRTLRGHEARVWSLAVSPEGTQIASAAGDGTVRLWTCVSPARTSPTATLPMSPIVDLCFTPAGAAFVTASPNSGVALWRWDGSTQQPTCKQLIAEQGASCAVYDDALDQLITGDTAGSLHLSKWAAEPSTLPLPRQARAITALAVSRDGRRLASASEDRSVQWCDLPSRRILWRIEHPNEVPLCLAASPNGRVVVVGYTGGEVRLCDGDSGELLWTHHAHRGSVRRLNFTPDGERLVTASLDRTARVWDSTTGQELAVLHGHPDAVTCIDVSPDGTTLATGDSRGGLRLWDLATLQELFSLTTELRLMHDLGFSPDGHWLVVAGEDKNGHGHVQAFSASE